MFLRKKDRPELLADPYYSEIAKAKEEAFRDFDPISPAVSVAAASDTGPASVLPTGNKRAAIYEQHRGLFLVHSWRPSTMPAQVADIVIQLYQHGEGPLTEGKIEMVEYDLGPKFSPVPIAKTNRQQNFRRRRVHHFTSRRVARF